MELGGDRFSCVCFLRLCAFARSLGYSSSSGSLRAGFLKLGYSTYPLVGKW